MSGAHVELSRAPPPNPSEKFFIIRGNAEQIDNAQRMISEKIGLATSPMSGGRKMKVADIGGRDRNDLGVFSIITVTFFVCSLSQVLVKEALRVV